MGMQQTSQALAALLRAIELQPNLAEAHCALGLVYHQTGQTDQSIAASRAALAIRPDFPEALCNLAIALKEKNQLDEATVHLRAALALRPQFPDAQLGLATVLSRQCRFEEAVDMVRAAQALRPDFPEANFCAGVALMNLGRLDQALEEFGKGLARHPDWAEAHCAVGMVRLIQGDFSGGFPEYEWRTRTAEKFSIHGEFEQPRWDGSPLAGRRILLHAEQGAGDTIQFVRYVPLVAQQGGTVILEIQPGLTRLLSQLSHVSQVIGQGDPLPQFDVHCPLISLPGLMGTTLDLAPDHPKSIPAPRSYLIADQNLTDRWRQRLGSITTNLGVARNVGVAWSGNPANGRNHIRSIPFSALQHLADTPDIRWFSLQKGLAANDAHRAGAKPNLIDWTDELTDFADTAALISALDVVITVDTSIAHLAGALGKPVWVLLAYVPDWRWLLDRAGSPWYPTMRLFRQQKIGDWRAPVDAVAKALEALDRP
jgi:tetratricopeptide (TPR) repeat protein